MLPPKVLFSYMHIKKEVNGTRKGCLLQILIHKKYLDFGLLSRRYKIS